MLNKIFHTLYCLSVGLTLMFCTQSCIKNDIPYPYIQLFITDIKANGLLGSPIIVNDERTVTLNLSDTVNMKKVLITDLTVTEGAKSTLYPNTVVDLSNNYPVTLSLYQDYNWKIVGKQNIERRFVVKGQVGTADFNTQSKIASVNISDRTSLKNIELTDLKLGPTGSTINMSSSLPLIDWTVHGNYAKATVLVNFRDFIVMEEWTLYVFQVSSTVNTSAADAWVNVAWLYGEGLEGENNGFEIREATATEWEVVDPSYVTHNGGSFSARIPHLKSETSYVCRAYSGADKGSELSFTTSKGIELSNGSFDYWHQVGKVWNPWAENGSPFWDSGNKGATTLGESNTQPTSDVCGSASVGSKAAKLESKFIGIGSIGKFAAGNLFVGEFKRVDGTNGILDFGKPFTARPTKLKGYYKYTSAPVNYASSEFEAMKGQPDTCSIYIAIGDWDMPVEIRTNPKNAKYFDKNDSHIIAYAEFNSGTSVANYTPFELELEYRSTSRIPTYLIVVCSASKYGDYFTGGAGAVMCVDEFMLEYDY